MKKQAILFPFRIEEDNEERYLAAQKAAQSKQLPLIFFTTIKGKQEEEQVKDTVYLYLLRLKGYYQTLTNNWKIKEPNGSKIIIKNGNLQKQMQRFMASSSMELIVFS